MARTRQTDFYVQRLLAGLYSFAVHFTGDASAGERAWRAGRTAIDDASDGQGSIRSQAFQRCSARWTSAEWRMPGQGR